MAAYDNPDPDWVAIGFLAKLAGLQWLRLRLAVVADRLRLQKVFDTDAKAVFELDETKGMLFDIKTESLLFGSFPPTATIASNSEIPWDEAVRKAMRGACDDYLKEKISTLNELHLQMTKHFVELSQGIREDEPDFGPYLELRGELRRRAEWNGYCENPIPDEVEKGASKPKRKRRKPGSKELTDVQELLAHGVETLHKFDRTSLSVGKLQPVTYDDLERETDVKKGKAMTAFFDECFGGNKAYRRLCTDEKSLAFALAKLSHEGSNTMLELTAKMLAEIKADSAD